MVESDLISMKLLDWTRVVRGRFSRRRALTTIGAGAVSTAFLAACGGEDDGSIRHRTLRANGINVHIAESGRGPLIILLHGFPELWYSWRHQLAFLAAAGYHAVAPDLRGYGGSDAPPAVEAYSMKEMAGDVVGLMDSLGSEKAVLVGHDWGANIAWQGARLIPDRVGAVAALGVPYSPELPTTDVIRRFAGDKFNFSLAFQTDGAEAELEADVRGTIRRFLYTFSGEAPPGTINYLFTAKSAALPILEGMPEPESLPGWLSEQDVDVYSQAFQRSGFHGALNRYRNLDRDASELAGLPTTVSQPVLFVGGELDTAVRFGSLDAMRESAPNLTRLVILPDCGHWTQQERAEEVNRELLPFLKSQSPT
jgi:pimeloyl-ACP methyl ester carboxylesterase